MSTSKHIDKICAAAAALALALTLLFVSGGGFGLAAAGDSGDEDGQFTAGDLDGAWDAAGAARIVLTGDGADIDGYGACFYDGRVHILSGGRYVLSGELLNGNVVVEASSGNQVWLLLDGVSIHCEDSAALLVEQAEKVFLTLADGTENTLSSGGTYSGEAVSAGIDGTVYSRDDLTINGGGALAVIAAYQHGIVCNDNFVMTGGAVSVTAAQDGVHANDSARFCGMDLTITAGDDGITVSNDAGTAYFYMASGSLTIPSCYEGVEAVDVTVAGGTLDISPTDDGLNANGGGESAIRITGGEVRIVNAAGRDADGLDSNGSIFIRGGSIFLSLAGDGGNCAIDYGSENGGVCEISGGAVIAAGGSAMAEGFDSTSTQGFLMQTVSGEAGTAVELRDEAGNVLLSGEIPCAFTSLVLSAPGLRVGDTCTLSVGGVETETVVDNTAVQAGMFGGGLGGSMEEPPSGETPEGTAPDGGMPNGMIPGGGTSGSPGADGVRPDTGGQMPGRGRLNLPEGGTQDGAPFQRQDLEQDRTQAPAGSEASGLSTQALVLVGVSVLFLAAGLLIAIKTKH